MNENETHLIEFPKEGCVYVKEDQSILDAALSAGIPLFHVCGGKARCSTCRVLVIKGNEQLTPPNAKEKLLNDQMKFPPNVRLACQTFVTGGPVNLVRIIQDETDIGLYVGRAAGASTQQLGEEKVMVLFFLDIRNFTPFVESHLPFDVIHIIRKLFSIFQTIIETNGGKILETAGDGLYAVFGGNQDNMASAQSAVQSGFSIMADIEALNETYFTSYFDETIQIGIGIHIGKVISGSVSIGEEERSVVMGFPVNVAARLQAATRELNNDFVVSAQIYDLLISPPPCLEPTSIQVKGIEDPITVYLLGKAFY